MSSLLALNAQIVLDTIFLTMEDVSLSAQLEAILHLTIPVLNVVMDTSGMEENAQSSVPKVNILILQPTNVSVQLAITGLEKFVLLAPAERNIETKLLPVNAQLGPDGTDLDALNLILV